MASVHYSASAKAKVPRFVQCEKCGHGYGYWLKRTGFGNASSFLGIGMSTGHQRAARDAEFDLEMKLKHDCEAVPCPECGWYQKHMIPQARHERYNWVQQVSWAGLAVAVFLFLSPGFLLQGADRMPALWIVFRGIQLLG